MNLSARSIYACLAGIELALQFGTKSPVQIRVISERHDIPSRFLVQILLQLKSAGIVSSTRGASGGYQLCRAPEEISLWQIIEAVENSADSTPAVPGNSAERRTLTAAWNKAHSAYRQVLESLSLKMVVEQIGNGNEPMYFI